jgi:CNT family concentrative nucleoside transporter
MTYVIKGFSWLFTKLMRISGAESLVAASNIFAGVESNLTIKPYMSRMTRSEFCTILTTGMATVASNVLVFIPDVVFTTGHLICHTRAWLLVMSKIIFPETMPANARPASSHIAKGKHFRR